MENSQIEAYNLNSKGVEKNEFKEIVSKTKILRPYYVPINAYVNRKVKVGTKEENIEAPLLASLVTAYSKDEAKHLAEESLKEQNAYVISIDEPLTCEEYLKKQEKDIEKWRELVDKNYSRKKQKTLETLTQQP